MKSLTTVVLVTCLPSVALAQGRVEGIYINGTSGTAAVFDPNIDYGPGNLGGPVGNTAADLSGLDFSGSINFDYDVAPYSGHMGGNANISYGPNASPGIGGDFSDLYFEGNAHSNTSGGEVGYTGNFTGSTIVSMTFSVDEATPWSWEGDVAGWATGDAQASYQIYIMPMMETDFPGGRQLMPAGDMIVYDILDAAATGSFDAHVAQSGVLAPGIYAMRISIDANAGLWYGPGAGEASVTLSNGLFHLGGAVPAPAASGLLALTGLAMSRRNRRL